MKIIDCTEFANKVKSESHYTDGPWSDWVNWKSLITIDGYTHAIEGGKLWEITKFGPSAVTADIEIYKR